MPDLSMFFYNGIGYQGRSALLPPGFLKKANNVSFESVGKQKLRRSFSSVNSTAVNSIHSIKRFSNVILIGDSTYLRYRSSESTGDFVSLGSAFANSIFSFDSYKGFLMGANGTDNILFDEYGNLYPGRVANPTSAPTLADSGVAGNPNDTYAGYVSYLITWPNGNTYETGISSGAEVTVSSKKISWSNIPVCPYQAYSGTEPTIHRKLYRGPGTGGTIADIYLVTTITDNTTTTYTDNETDSQLAANGGCGVENYDQPPSNIKYIAVNYGRIFYIDTSNTNRLYHTDAVAGADADENESLMPLSVTSGNWDDIRVSGYGEADPQGLVTWGIFLYIPMKHTWIRKQGDDEPDTWSFKKMWANMGISAPHSISKSISPSGILGVSNEITNMPGLSLFNGHTSQLIAREQLSYIFEEDLNISAIDQCRGKFDGRYYHLLYPNGSNTSPNIWAAIDLGTYGTDGSVKLAYWTDLNGVSIDVYEDGSKMYIGGSDGIVRQNSGTESINIDLQTQDLVGDNEKNLNNVKKTLKELYYNIDTGNSKVKLYITIDGIEAKWPDGSDYIELSGNKDKVQHIPSLPPNFEGYLFDFRLIGKNLKTFELYSPWRLVFDVTA